MLCGAANTRAAARGRNGWHRVTTLTTDGMLFDNDTRDRQAQGTAAPPVDTDGMVRKAEEAAAFLEALSDTGRLMILCHLTTGEKSVTELENLLDSRQAAVSQQLARLRLEGLVTCRRGGKAIYYSLADERARRMLDLVYEMFCKPA